MEQELHSKALEVLVMNVEDRPADTELRELERENERLRAILAKKDEHVVAKGCTHLAIEFCQTVAILLAIPVAVFVVALQIAGVFYEWPLEAVGFGFAYLLILLLKVGIPVALVFLIAIGVRKHYRIRSTE